MAGRCLFCNSCTWRSGAAVQQSAIVAVVAVGAVGAVAVEAVETVGAVGVPACCGCPALVKSPRRASDAAVVAPPEARRAVHRDVHLDTLVHHPDVFGGRSDLRHAEPEDCGEAAEKRKGCRKQGKGGCGRRAVYTWRRLRLMSLVDWRRGSWSLARRPQK